MAETEWYNVKVVMLGNSGVGKTKIVERFVNGLFVEEGPITLSATMFSKNLEFPEQKTTFKVAVWDTAGQEQYRSLGKSFYQNAQAAVLVYDITKADSFEGIYYWVNELKSNVREDIELVIVGNKCDLEEDETIRHDKARDYAESIHATFILASAKENICINKIFTGICEKLMPPPEERAANPDWKVSNS
jgi:small GTP-binding protein